MTAADGTELSVKLVRGNEPAWRSYREAGFHRFPEPESIEERSKGKSVVVTYQVEPPTGQWRESDRGTYTLELPAYQAADASGNYAAATRLGEFRVLVAGKR